jgi:hypothetical protein
LLDGMTSLDTLLVPEIIGDEFATHPVLVVGGTLAEDFFPHHGKADDLPEKVHHLLGP